ncbi:MAG TPA: hypothetical protein VK658_14690, partial [Chryseolinea sp.]|nr:hypothetical protein [Chryseolinea sp.]
PNLLVELMDLVDAGKISFSVASQRVFPELLKNPAKSALEVAQRLNVIQDSNEDSMLPLIDSILKEFPLKVEEYKSGKKGIVGMFMGELMKRSKGKADPKVANALITKKLEEV